MRPLFYLALPNLFFSTPGGLMPVASYLLRPQRPLDRRPSRARLAVDWVAGRWPWLLAVLCACVLVVVVFLPGLPGSFIFDDRANIAQNVSLYMTGLDHVSAWRAASSFPYGPGLRLLPMLSFGLDYFRTGSFDPAAYKATNLAIHLLTFVVLAGFLRRLLLLAGRPASQATWLALAVALLWAIHPLQVSSVLYVVQRMQTMASLFLLMALWAYLHMRQAQIDGRPWWHAAFLVLAGWLLALASKEDAALLPAYTLLLELTVLRFAMHTPAAGRWLARGYALAVLAGVVLFVFWVVPRFGSLETFPWRDFNSYERVLSQGRVLLMYLGQIIWPLPDNMPFYYDNYPVSRGWLAPPATLLAWLALAVLAIVAWGLRQRLPLFGLGLLWFLAGHFVTSNVLGLELVFEHRNHLPIIGMILAMADLASRLRRGVAIGLLALALTGCALGTHARAVIWGDELLMARRSVELAPSSGRAWVELCRVHFERSGNDVASDEFQRAIDACTQGGLQGRSLIALSNAIILKAQRGEQATTDWRRLHAGLQQASMSPENLRIAATLAGNASNDLPLDPAAVLQAIDIIDRRGTLAAQDNLVVARFILERTDTPERAFHYFEQAVQRAPSDGQLVAAILADLRARGRDDWATQLTRGQGSGDE